MSVVQSGFAILSFWPKPIQVIFGGFHPISGPTRSRPVRPERSNQVKPAKTRLAPPPGPPDSEPEAQDPQRGSSLVKASQAWLCRPAPPDPRPETQIPKERVKPGQAVGSPELGIPGGRWQRRPAAESASEPVPGRLRHHCSNPKIQEKIQNPIFKPDESAVFWLFLPAEFLCIIWLMR